MLRELLADPEGAFGDEVVRLRLLKAIEGLVGADTMMMDICEVVVVVVVVVVVFVVFVVIVLVVVKAE